MLPVGHGNAIPGAISVLAALGLCLLCFFEHRNSVRPSDGIIIYVGLLVVKDFIDLTRPSHYYETMHLIPLIARLLILSSLLVAESMSKIDILDAPYQSLVSEELSGAFGRVLFWWINPVLKEGHRGILFHEDLPRIDQAFSSGFLRERIIHAWKCRCKDDSAPLRGTGSVTDVLSSKSSHPVHSASCSDEMFPVGISIPSSTAPLPNNLPLRPAHAY